MPAQSFDWRDDPSGTMLAVPQVRARFIRREPEATGGGGGETFHTHEESEAIETWVVLEGRVRFEFEVDGERSEVIAGPGQAVFALPHEKHRVTCAGDEPCVYFLTVSPHRAPTHTHYDAQGNRRPTTPGAVRPTWKGQPAIGVKE
jgi:mannose-6-phosphate isomerase-like protein (cupin superfamily)